MCTFGVLDTEEPQMKTEETSPALQQLKVPEFRHSYTFHVDDEEHDYPTTIDADDVVVLDLLDDANTGHRVYRGEYVDTIVTIKVLYRGSELNKFFDHHQQINQLATLYHPNVVQFYGTACIDPVEEYGICGIREYLRHQDLRSLLSRGNNIALEWFNDTKLCKVELARGVLEALVFFDQLAESFGHHGRLHSRNVLLSDEYTPKIVNFGLYAVLRREIRRENKANLRAHFWSPPEKIRGAKCGRREDMYSFGVILTELDTQQLPFDDIAERFDSDMDLLDAITFDSLRPSMSRECSPELREFAMKCMAADAGDRPSPKEALVELNELEKRHYQSNQLVE